MELNPESVATAVTTVAGALQSVAWIKDHVPNNDVISTHFDVDGQRLAGNEKIEIERTDFGEGQWLFNVKELAGYTFQRFPVIDSGITELLGFTDEEPYNPVADGWRWIATPSPNTIIGGNATHKNVLVEFVVVGYRSDALLEYFSSTE